MLFNSCARSIYCVQGLLFKARLADRPRSHYNSSGKVDEVPSLQTNYLWRL